MRRSTRLAAAIVLSAAPLCAWAQPLTGELRSQFVDGGVPTCLDSAKKSFAGNEAFMEKAGVTDATISAYCRCQMEGVADQVTPDQYAQLLKGTPPPEIKDYALAANKKCGPLLAPNAKQ